MIKVDELLKRLRQANVRLWLEGDQIRYSAPKDAMTSELAGQIAECKDELRRVLQASQLNLTPAANSLIPRSRPEYPPLSFAQERVWFLHQLEGGTPAYNVFKAFNLSGPLDVDQLRKSLADVVSRHETLRTTFPDRNGVPSQRITQACDTPLVIVDLQGVEEADRNRQITELCLAAVREPFNLTSGPLLRSTLVQLDSVQHLLIFVMHHIITDGWSIDILLQEIAHAYERRLSGLRDAVAPNPLQYLDFTLWQREWLSQENLRPYLEFWEQELAGAPEISTLPPDYPRPPEASFRGATLPIHFRDKLSADVIAIATRTGTTPFMVILAGFTALLHRYTSMEDIVIGAPVAARTHVDLESIIGFFVNTLTLRINLSGDPTFEQLLERTRNKTLLALTYQHLPFELLVKHLHIERDLSRNPLFQVMFSMRMGPGHPTQMADVEISTFPLDTQVSRFDLNLMLWQRGSEFSGHWEFSTDLYDQSTVERFSQHFLRFLENVISHPQQTITSIPLLDEGERELLLRQSTSSTTSDSSVTCVHDFFEAQVERSPHAIALEFDGRSLSYEELNTKANQLAHRLRAKDIRPNDRVGINLPRSMEMIVALLGVLKAGAAYVPLDNTLPKSRIEMMLSDSEVKILLTQEEQSSQHLAFDGEAMWVNISDDASASEADSNPMSRANGDDLVYVTYTSGSTGRPKGVAMPHRSLVNMLTWQLGHTCASSARTLQFTTLGFDVSFQEILTTLSGGGTLILISEHERQDFRLLVKRIAESGVERLFLPYSALQMLAEVVVEAGVADLAVKEIITAGEQLRITPAVVQLFSRLTGCVLHNQYGPTEAHVVTAHTLSGEPEAWPRLPPIGRPITNVQSFILDPYLEPVPVGVVGELFIGGSGLAHGYLNRPEENTERFIENPFSSDPDARLFRTGDFARWRPDGEIDFLGRRDQQVKIRGYRVELGEIEAALAMHEDVRECVIKLDDESQTLANLWAFVVARPGARPSKSDLQSYLRSQLPEYMLPSRFFVLDEIPFTLSGKIDRSVLTGDAGQELGETLHHVAPRDPLESQIAEVWEQVLKVGPIGANDNFFDLGGHSMLALQLLSALKQATGVDLSVAALFRAPTVAEQAQLLRKRDWKSRGASLIPIREGSSGQPIFFIHWAGGSVLVYRELIQRLKPELSVYGFQAYGVDRSVRPHTRIEEMAAHYVRELREVQPVGPYCLAGASMGGSIAFEMACQLEAQGAEVGLVALFDTVGRPNLGALPLRERVRLHSRNIRAGESQSAFGYLFERTIIRLRRGFYSAVIGLGIPLPRWMWNLKETTRYAFKHYQPGAYAGDVLLFRAIERGPGSPVSLFLGWEDVVSGGIDIIDVPGKHGTMLSEPNVKVVAKVLNEILAQTRQNPTRPKTDQERGAIDHG